MRILRAAEHHRRLLPGDVAVRAKGAVPWSVDNLREGGSQNVWVIGVRIQRLAGHRCFAVIQKFFGGVSQFLGYKCDSHFRKLSPGDGFLVVALQLLWNKFRLNGLVNFRSRPCRWSGQNRNAQQGYT